MCFNTRSQGTLDGLAFSLFQLRPAIGAIVGVARGGLIAAWTGDARLLVAVVDEEITDVGNPGEGVGKNEDGILFVKHGVGEKYQRTGQTEPPE